jgi:hypothetical protein
VALQVSDADEAEAGLRRLVAASSDGAGGMGSVGFVVAGDYALLAESQELAGRYAARAEDATLAEDSRFAADMGAVADGIATLWVDNGAAAKEVAGGMVRIPSGTGSAPGAGDAGRSTMVVRFDGPDVLEVTGEVTGSSSTGWATHRVAGVEDLPGTSVFALGVADGDELVPRVFDELTSSMQTGGSGPEVDEMVSGLESTLGLKVPEDLALLLGDNLVAALDGTPSRTVEVGARVSTDAERAQAVLERLLRDVWPETDIRRVGEDLVVASTRDQADRMSGGAGGTLGDLPAFGRALPDLAEADVALWLDPRGVTAAVFGGPGAAPGAGDVDPDLEPVDGIGVTARSGTDGSGTFRFRLVAH